MGVQISGRNRQAGATLHKGWEEDAMIPESKQAATIGTLIIYMARYAALYFR
jgi:hypothetical protein